MPLIGRVYHFGRNCSINQSSLFFFSKLHEKLLVYTLAYKATPSKNIIKSWILVQYYTKSIESNNRKFHQHFPVSKLALNCPHPFNGKIAYANNLHWKT